MGIGVKAKGLHSKTKPISICVCFKSNVGWIQNGRMWKLCGSYYSREAVTTLYLRTTTHHKSILRHVCFSHKSWPVCRWNGVSFQIGAYPFIHTAFPWILDHENNPPAIHNRERYRRQQRWASHLRWHGGWVRGPVQRLEAHHGTPYNCWQEPAGDLFRSGWPKNGDPDQWIQQELDLLKPIL